MITFPLADIINWGWLRIGPPYIYVNIDPVIVHLGPLALRWYGLMYVVGIIIALWVIKGYTERRGISQDLVYRVLWWCIAAGLIGGRLYFVIQQPNLSSYYLANPIHIIATWEGGMAFFGAIFLVIPTLMWRARVERVNPLVLVDAGVLFGAAGQIFGRIGNLINGDIVGYPSTLPWSTVYIHPSSWACLPGSTICGIPVQPAAGYELLTNVVVLLGLFYLSRHTKRPGILMLAYLYCYVITQFLIFFTRANIDVQILEWHLKQAQWTSLVLFVLLLPITYWVLHSRYSKPIPDGELAATYGILQQPKEDKPGTAQTQDEVAINDSQIEQVADEQDTTPQAAEVEVVNTTDDEETQHLDDEQPVPAPEVTEVINIADDKTQPIDEEQPVPAPEEVVNSTEEEKDITGKKASVKGNLIPNSPETP